MVELSYVITDPLGFHARPVMRLASEAARWKSDVTVRHGAHVASGRDPMALMGLEAGPGAELAITVEGPDENDAAEFIEHTLREL